MNEQECLDILKQKKEACWGETRTGSLEEYRDCPSSQGPGQRAKALVRSNLARDIKATRKPPT